jgi:hypothetical protein
MITLASDYSKLNLRMQQPLQIKRTKFYKT